MTKQCKNCNETKDLDLFPNHKSNLDGKAGSCKSCTAAYMKKYYQKNKARLQEKHEEWKSNNPGKMTEYRRAWKQRNPEKVKEASKAYDKSTKDKRAAREAKRRAAKLDRTPKWLTDSDYKWIEWYYTQARRLTDVTGIEHHVDHIIPLQGETVSGLHCPTNLQILTATENIRKSNKFEGLLWQDR